MMIEDELVSGFLKNVILRPKAEESHHYKAKIREQLETSSMISACSSGSASIKSKAIKLEVK